MSTNNSSQTLFRFVSLRNPQLTEAEPSKNLGFVHKPKTLNTLFDEAIPKEVWDSSNSSKIAALEKQIPAIESKNANYFYKTKKEVIRDFSDYFTAAELIAKGKLENITNYLPAISNEFPANYAKLWDNLIYQVLTQKDFYVKETILQIIKAVHFNKYKNSTSHTELKDAKVVMPGRLFVDTIIDDGVDAEDLPNIFTVNESRIAGAYITEDPNFSKVSASVERRLASYAEKNTELALAVSEKNRLENLKTEIDLVSKNYQREYSAALATAQENHQAVVKPLLDDYEAKLNAVRDTFTSSQTPEEQQALLDAVKYPTLPNFQFSFPALDTEYLKEKLSQPSFETMDFILHKEYNGDGSVLGETTTQRIAAVEENTRTLSVDGIFGVDELNTILTTQKSDYTNTIISATEITQQEYANIGGALVPIQNATAQNAFSAVLTPKRNRRGSIFSFEYLYDFDMVLEVPDSSWELESVECEVKDPIGNTQKYTPKEFVVDGVKLLVNNIFNDQFSKTQLESFTEFTAKVYFKNNREGSLVFRLNNPTSDNYFAKLNLTVERTGKKAFNPKNFGIKRLGIADYLKVVQSVHAYVPGEVSNIENVMASELRHKSISERTTTEDTAITSKSQEVEKMTDTTKVNRAEMQSEVARELDRQQDFQSHANFSKGGIWKIDVGASYANHTAQHDSTRQAVTKAQEITEKALERVVTKISEERIQKIVHEVQLQNVHEFDNRGKIGGEAPKHITGVYRWVDKKMKNQIYNYGKRTMFEFMIPEPARLHRLATKSYKSVLTAPIDPRKVSGNKQMKDANVEVNVLQYWADYYGIKVEPLLPDTNQIIHSATGVPEREKGFGVDYTHFVIPDNYVARNASFSCRSSRHSGGGLQGSRYSEVFCSNLKGDMIGLSERGGDINFDQSISGLNVTGNVEFKVKGHNVKNYHIKVTVNCELNDTYIISWKKTNFEEIIKAYDQKYKEFQEAQKAADDAAKAEEEKNKDKVSTFYREMESNILKHNCIAYLLQDYNGIGKALATDDNQTMESLSVTIDENLDAYTALSKFLEQAFEWNVMDYTFYPYYWAENKHWKEMYLSAELDPLFRNFLQAGMARVVVTVKPGFEDAVNFYMSTGKIWNGGEVPVIGDPMFLSIADELKQPTGKPQGKYWITTIPTSLTILQAKSVGLEVTDALPVFPETDVENCENPEELVFESPFKLNDITMLASDKESSTIS